MGMFFQKQLHSNGRCFRTSEAAKLKAMEGPFTIFAGVVLGLRMAVTPPRLIDVCSLASHVIERNARHGFVGHWDQVVVDDIKEFEGSGFIASLQETILRCTICGAG